MTDVGAFDDLEDGAATRVDVDGEPVAVVRIGENVYAIGDICSHANISLSEGEVWCDELELECPKHASAFSLVTGEPVTLPATQPVSVYVATVADGRVVVTAPTDESPPDESPPDESPPDESLEGSCS
jgi:3-phenylpropionate/trans-cinnamate dioxygenase ferredoxin subunit